MSYTFKQFSVGTTDVTLPIYDPETPVGTGPTVSAAIPLLGGGMFDGYGTGRAPLAIPYDLTWRAVAVEDTAVALDTALRTLRGLRGQQGQLYREMADGALQWCYARVLELPPQTADATTQAVEVVFQVLSPWYGAAMDGDGWLLDDGFYLDDGLYFDTSTVTTLTTPAGQIIAYTYDGDAETHDIIITVTAGSADITALQVATGTYYEWRYTGTIVIGQALVVDCGARTVKNNGVSDYANFALTNVHARSHWFNRIPGGGTTEVTYTGGGAGSTIAFAYNEAYE